MKKRLDENKRKEVRKILEQGEEVIVKEAHLIFDGRQYSLKIPKKIIEELEMNTDSDVVRIELTRSPFHLSKKNKLKMELVRKDEEEK
jgi:hypothetical protein